MTRMTRLRARGGVRDRPPIIDDDDEEMYNPVPTSAKKRKAGVGRKPVVEKVVERVGKYKELVMETMAIELYYSFGTFQKNQ